MKTSKIICIGKGKKVNPGSIIKLTIDMDDLYVLSYERDGGYSIDLHISKTRKPDHLGRQFNVYAEYKDPVKYTLYPF